MTSQTRHQTAVAPNAVLLAAGFAALWLLLAIVRPETTLHLGPVIVPLVPAFVRQPQERRVPSVLSATAIALAVTFVLELTGHLDGPTLSPFPNALVESIVFIAGGTVAALSYVRLNR